MTDYIRSEQLLPPDEVDAIIAYTPVEPLTKDDITSWNEKVMEIGRLSANRACGCAA